jgi:hydroxymethylpyrimidine/phosphomethylpyrimidine kinase
MEIVLSIAGSDPSAGAGIQQDLKTITAMGCYGTTVITALTSQNTQGVKDVMTVPPDVVASQLQSILEDFDVKSIKIGQIPNTETAETIIKTLRFFYKKDKPYIPIVYDPVMISTSGNRLMSPDCIQYIQEHLFPLCFLITPNIPEAEQLTGYTLTNEEDYLKAGKALTQKYGINTLLKGGHAQGRAMTDRLFLTNGTLHEYHSEKIDSTNLHGTGCTLSSAIASALALGANLTEAVSQAKKFVSDAIQGGKDLRIGHGNGPIWNF